ncbi:MAG: hypothetical protein NVSMB31_05370 [Vulcanimicrobiaceae bacterium]
MLLVTACGSPSDSLSFKAPARFGEPRNIMGMAQVWQSQDQKQMLTLMRLPFGTDPNKALEASTFKEAQLQKQERIRICDNQPATHFVLLKADVHQRIEAVMRAAGKTTYMAMYGYPDHVAPDDQAEAAIRDLCSK